MTSGDDNTSTPPADDAGFGALPDDLRRLARLVDDNNLSELRYEDGDLRITLRTAAFFRPAAPGSVPAAAAPSAHEEIVLHDEEIPLEEALPGGAAADDLLRIEAPVMGVFYRSPAPGEPHFVEVGDAIEVGQIIGMIEAMKVFSEIPAEVAGIVREIPARNGALVQPGDPLILVELAE